MWLLCVRPFIYKFPCLQQCFLLGFIGPLQSDKMRQPSTSARPQHLMELSSGWCCLGWHFIFLKKRKKFLQFFTIFLYYSVRYFLEENPARRTFSWCRWWCCLCYLRYLLLFHFICSNDKENINIFAWHCKQPNRTRVVAATATAASPKTTMLKMNEIKC